MSEKCHYFAATHKYHLYSTSPTFSVSSNLHKRHNAVLFEHDYTLGLGVTTQTQLLSLRTQYSATRVDTTIDFP